MISPPTSSSLLALLTLLNLSQQTNAQSLEGCAAVHCPNRYEDMLSPTCQVASTDMRLIGLLSAQFELPERDLTWTIGDSGLQTTIEGNERTVTRSFYLGTPQTLNLTTPDLTFRGCAIFITSPETGAYQVYSQGAPQYANTASCAGSMGQTCIDDLTARVQQFVVSGPDANGDDFCNGIAQGLQEQAPSTCYILTQDARIEAVALTGPTAPQPVSAAENSTSNCWPTLPKMNDLTKVFEYDHVAQLNETVPWLGYTPLLTVFAPSGNMTDGDVEVDLACMKTVDSDDFSAGTARNGSGTQADGMEGAAVIVRGSLGVVVLVIGALLLLF